MNLIKLLLWKVGIAKYPTTNLTRLKELQKDYLAAVKVAAELTVKLEEATKPKKTSNRRRKPATKK